jgi:hypothetical protein
MRERSQTRAVGAAVTLVLLLGACSDDNTTNQTATGPTTEATKPQEEETTSLVTAPERDRIDLAKPTFSNPTSITNPLFPISEVTQVVQLGEDAGDPLRVEVTLLPETKTVEWEGDQVETVVSHFVAYLDGRIVETATDFFAQADDGAVWYFGEDVTNYEEGVVADHEGTWLAGKDGPPGMIMPANPQVGDVYRPENIPGLVFEEVTVKSIGETLDGPQGPVEDVVLVQELLMDGVREDKVFAPGYGEFRAQAPDELVDVAIGVPIDATPGPVPDEVATISSGAADLFETADGDDGGNAALVDSMAAAWDAFGAGDGPELLECQMSDALDALAVAVDAGSPGEVRQAAINTSQAALDLELRYRTPAEVDLDRLAVWSRQASADADADDQGSVTGDVASLEAIWTRVGHTVDPSSAEAVEGHLRDLSAAVEGEDLTAAADVAATLEDLTAGLEPAR